jgi:hypothetical protein
MYASVRIAGIEERAERSGPMGRADNTDDIKNLVGVAGQELSKANQSIKAMALRLERAEQVHMHTYIHTHIQGGSSHQGHGIAVGMSRTGTHTYIYTHAYKANQVIQAMALR